MEYRRSSVRTSGAFWGKSPYADGLTYGMYGTDGDYNNSLTYMFGEMTNKFGFMVFTADRDQIHYEDGFDTDYDAEVAAESWIEQNASQYITASVASRKMSYYNPDDPTFFGEDIDPGDGLYGTVWFGFPEDGENAFNIEAVEQGDGTLKCDVMSPEDYDHGNGYIGVDSVDSFTATDWGNMYDVFNQRFIFGPLGPIINNYFSALYDDDDQDEFASVNRASRTRAIASDGQFVFYDEKFNPGNGLYLVAYYGPENDKRDSLVLELEGDDVTYLTCTVKSPDGTVIDTFTARDWESYKSSFYGEMDYGGFDFDGFLNDWLDRKYGISAGPNTASRNSSVKRSYISEFDTWGESVDSYNEDGPFHATIAYGEPYNDDNSVTMEAVGDNGVNGPVNCKVLDISWDNVVDTFQAETWDEAVREFEYRCRQYEYDEYLESDDEEFLRMNGVDASRKLSNNRDYEFYGMTRIDETTGIAYYGPENDQEESLKIKIKGNDWLGYRCDVFTHSSFLADSFNSLSWDEIPEDFMREVGIHKLGRYLDEYFDDQEDNKYWMDKFKSLMASKQLRSSKVHKTAKRKMTMKEKLALINEDKLDEEDDPINPFF